MRVLIVEDNRTEQKLIQHMLDEWGYETEVSEDGIRAWQRILEDDAPDLLILDWMLPGIPGVEICRRLREMKRNCYIILLTAKDHRDDVIMGLQSGADDYVQKPFHREEFKARVRNAKRVLDLQEDLQKQVKELEQALAKVDQLQGLIPICCYCKNIRSDDNYWQRLEAYFQEQANVQFSHGICPSCFDTMFEQTG